ncbi:MAG: YlbL family protein [Actinomycetota bacterium]
MAPALNPQTVQAEQAPARADKLGPKSYFWFGLRVIALFAIAVGALTVRLPLLVLEPGPTRDVSKLIQIDAPTYKSRGAFLLTTALVSNTEGITLLTALHAAFSSDEELVDRESIFPSDSTRLNTDRVHAAQMSESQEVAAVAALNEVGIPAEPNGAFVREVTGKLVADKLRPGDLITAVNSTPIIDRDDLKKVVEKRKPGEELSVTIRRDGQTSDVRLKTFASPATKSEPAKTRLGVLVIQSNKLPINIAIDAGDIGGPSAGLIFGLAIYDALVPLDLTKGRKIAGTGTISNADGKFGRVGPIGAVAEKVTAAAAKGVKVFVVPKANLKEARRVAPQEMMVVGASTLRQAIQAIKALS